MIRICYPGGGVIKCLKRPDGSTYATDALNSYEETNEIIFQSRVANSTDVFCVQTISECIGRMKNNLSDYSIGEYIYHDESAPYYVPVQWDPGSIYIVSGNDINSLSKKVISSEWSYGLMSNLGIYSWPTYSLIGLVFALVYLLTLMKTLLFIERHFSFVKLRRNKINLFFIVLRRFKSITNSPEDVKSCSFIIWVTFFFFLTPFLLMFKTAQVITPEPKIYSSYDQLIKSNVTIFYSSILSEERALLAPNDLNVKNKDIVYQIWKHFNQNGIYFASNRMKSTNNFLYLTNSITSGFVFVSTYAVASKIRKTFCSFSNPKQLFNVLMFQDKSQREVLNGFALRREFFNGKLIRRLRAAFEFNYQRRRTYRCFYGLQVVHKTPEHRKVQKEICLRNQFIRQEVSFVASDLSFFSFFFSYLVLAIFIAQMVLGSEKILA